MADVDINKFRASVVRDGSKPSSPGFIVSEGQDPVDPAGSGQNHLPVTIAAAATGLSITESQVLGGAGTTLQYLRGDASLATFPDLTGYVPYTGANQTVNLNTQQLLAGHTTITTNGSTDSLTVNHTSGSGKAINVTKGGNGEGLYINKTSGSGNAATIVGTLEATILKKTGGTSSQFLKADGSVDSSTYGTGTVTSVGLSSATSGVTIGSSPVTTSGTITLAIATASGSQNGLLSSTDWTTFNGKQNALTNPVTGTGSAGQVAYFTGTTAISSESNLFWDATNDRLGIATNTPATTLEVNGVGLFTGGSLTGNTKNGVYIYDTVIVSLAGGNARPLQIQGQTLSFFTGTTYTEKLKVFENGNVVISTSPSDNGAKLQVSGTATISGDLGVGRIPSSGYKVDIQGNGGLRILDNDVLRSIILTPPTSAGAAANVESNSANGLNLNSSNASGFITISTAGSARLTLASTGLATFSSSVTANGISSIGQEQAFTWQRTTGTSSDVYSLNSDSSGAYLYNNTTAKVLTYWNESGNVGIGTTLPSQALSIGDGTSTKYIRVHGTIADSYLGSDSVGTFFGNITNAPLYINTNGAERLRITSSGNVLIGTTTDNGVGKLQVSGGSITVAGGVRFSSSGADANRWSVYWNGGTGDLIVVNNISDIRAKKDFDYDIKGLETITKLKPLKFTWKDGTSHSTSVSGRLRQYGFIAQETMQADDFLAWHNESHDTWGIEQYESFTAVMVKAIQELKQEIDTLKN